MEFIPDAEKLNLLIPDAEKLNLIFSHAAAPAFFLGAVAGFVSLMSSRLSIILERIASARARQDADPSLDELDREVDQLARRAQLLGDGVLLSLCSGICATLLLVLMFVSQFAGFHHVYGAALLFVVATVLLGFALIRFAQEAMSTRTELRKLSPSSTTPPRRSPGK